MSSSSSRSKDDSNVMINGLATLEMGSPTRSSRTKKSRSIHHGWCSWLSQVTDNKQVTYCFVGSVGTLCCLLAGLIVTIAVVTATSASTTTTTTTPVVVNPSSPTNNNPTNTPTNTKTPVQEALQNAITMIGSPCNAVDGTGCNPSQIPLQHGTYSPLPTLLSLTTSNMEELLTVTEQPAGFTLRTNQGLMTNMRDFSSSSSTSFNIGATLPIDEVAFTASYGGQQAFSKMTSTTNAHYYSMMDAQVVLFEIHFRPGRMAAAVGDLQDDMNAVVESRELAAWKAFVKKYGTHFVSSLTYGGTIRASNDVTKTGTSSMTKWKTSQTETFKLGFSSFLGLDVSHTTSNGQTASQAQTEWSQSVTLKVHGGDSSTALGLEQSNKSDGSPVSAWVKSVTNATAVVINTQLRSITTLFAPEHQDVAKSMIAQIFRSCPGTMTLSGGWEACSGVGRCVLGSGSAPGTCTCPKDRIGVNCNTTHIACPSNCGTHGVCDYGTGKCVCSSNYMGETCTTMCGSREYGSTLYASVPDGADFHDENYAQPIGQRQEASDCVCQRLTGQNNAVAIWSQQETLVGESSARDEFTYPCRGVICDHFWGCNYYRKIHCAYNSEHVTCPTSSSR